ncbi:hypothetical protein [Rubrobacter xylanophilus]|uniref:hypothetical protein n=1 Tax=Rubrobacter xylanophilus TaxID=49319 RepID=UPI0012EAAE35|nr:hypothetical protein [Rubrobacter xylanophilus]
MNGTLAFGGGGVRRLVVFFLAALIAAVLSLGVAARAAQAQLLEAVLQVFTETTVSEQCNPDGTRDVTTTSDLGLATGNLEILGIGEEEFLQILLNVALFQTEYQRGGQVVATAQSGQTVALEPGTYTATTTVVNVNQLEAQLSERFPILQGIQLGVIDSSEQVVVPPCPADGGDDGGQQPGDGGQQPGRPGGGGQTVGGDTGDVGGDFSGLTLGDCSNIIQNSGNASISTVQYCQEVVNNITNDYGGGRPGVPGEPETGDGGDGLAVPGSGGEGGEATGPYPEGSGAASEQYAGEAASQYAGGEGAYGGLTELPDTGGSGLLALGAALALVAGGLLAGRLVR